jgi:5-methylcytosine-specific restriction endonuclease McrA
MASRKTRQRILDVVHSDSTFERVELREGEGFVGKCIHCQSELHVLHDGTPIGEVTVEHIVPRSRGETDDPKNLALACARCNHSKGKRHDHGSAT